MPSGLFSHHLAASLRTIFNIIKLSSALSLNISAPVAFIYICPCGIYLYLLLWHLSISAEQSRSLQSIELIESLPLSLRHKEMSVSNSTFKHSVIDEISFVNKKSTSSISIRLGSFSSTYVITKASLSQLS